jgi:hypothetical protein
LEQSGVPFEHSKAENMLLMKDTGSRILFRPVDEFERLRGTNLAWFGLDELTYTQEAAWLRLEGCLRDPKAVRLCGFAVWTPKGFDWVYRRFVVDDKVKDYEVVIAGPRENRFLLNRIPDFYDRLSKSYDENFFKQEVLGVYINQTGGACIQFFHKRSKCGDDRTGLEEPSIMGTGFQRRSDELTRRSDSEGSCDGVG